PGLTRTQDHAAQTKASHVEEAEQPDGERLAEEAEAMAPCWEGPGPAAPQALHRPRDPRGPRGADHDVVRRFRHAAALDGPGDVGERSHQGAKPAQYRRG